MKNIFLFIAICAVLLPCNSFAQSPNVLLVIMDDAGNGPIPSFAPNGPGQVKAIMPNLEELIQNGLSFDNLWVSPSCSPTRATILTGKYGFRTGVLNPSTSNAISSDEFSIFDAINEQSPTDYSTAVIGKWHLGPSGNNTDLDGPLEFGMDYFAGSLGGALPNYYDWSYIENGEIVNTTEYATTVYTDLAIDWINDQNNPWFCWLAYNTPHAPIHLPPLEMHNQGALPTDEASIQENELTYFIAMIESLDFELGRIKNNLSEEDWENTVVIVIGDNGTKSSLIRQPYNNNQSKGTVFQGGINTPMVVAGPEIARVNERETALVNGTDLYSTILQICGGSSESFEDSRSFTPLFSSTGMEIRNCAYADAGIDDDTGFEGFAIRDEQYKYAFSQNSGQEFFFDLLDDPFEDNNIINSLTAPQQNAFDELLNKQLSLTVGIEDVPASLSLYTYPNPISELLFVESKFEEEREFLIVDFQGKVIKKGRLIPGKNEIDLRGLTSGNYILSVPGYASRLIKL